MTHSTGGGDGTIDNQFPTTEEERRALRKAKQDRERQRLVNCFVDEAGADQALFHNSDGAAFADLIIEGSRQTWPIRSKQFRFAYIRYLQRELDRLTDAGAILALAFKPSLSKAAVNKAIDEFEMRAICSQTAREVHVRVASHGEDLLHRSLRSRLACRSESRRLVGRLFKIPRCVSGARPERVRSPFFPDAARRSPRCGRS